MLASTMQFSRYGRSRRPNRRVPRHGAPDLEINSAVRLAGPFGGTSVLTEGGAEAPVPSGPNSVPGLGSVRLTVPPARRVY
jgi:hypothetical protein